MKTPHSPAQPAAPTIEVFPLASPAPTVTATVCTTLAELIHSLGPRIDVANAWKVAPRTVNLRMQSPGTATLAELQKLAILAKLDLLKVLELAAYQLEHPQVAIPAPRRGAPTRQH